MTAAPPSPIENISPEEEYKIACLLMVFVAVSMPTLASNVMSQYSPAIEGRWTQNVLSAAERAVVLLMH